MPWTTPIYRVAAFLLWALALWHAWVCRGLFVDGSIFLREIAEREWFFDFYPPRLYAMYVTQLPALLALKLGVTDLHWLGRLLSLGMFGLPTIFYHMALARVRHDPVLMATVLAAIGVVFFTTSFFIVGEYNSLYAMAILTAVTLATTERLTLRDGIVLSLVGFLALRTYEAAIYLGPILVLMLLWRVWTARARPLLPALLFLAAAAGFAGGFWIALQSILVPWDAEHRNEAASTILNFWQNMQFLMALLATLTVTIWALVRPAALGTDRPYRWAAFWVFILAISPLFAFFSPLLGFADGQIRPLAKSHYVARTMGGGLISAIIFTIWIYASQVGQRLAVIQTLRMPIAARNLLAMGFALFIAVIPSDLYLTATWSRYLQSFLDIVASRSGLIPYEETSLSRPPHIFLIENWTIPSASIALRSTDTDGIVLTPRDYLGWQPFNPAERYPDLGRYFWRH